jgi:glycosyltransferase involved in cell wall biosynthesis
MILIATDAWEPQINGVVMTLKQIKKECDDVVFITPNDFKSIPCPFYKDIRLSWAWNVSRLIKKINPKYIHIATEGPIGFFVRNWCIQNNRNFTTSYHTKFPEYLHKMVGVPTELTYKYMKWFHSMSSAVMVTTNSLKQELEGRGFKNLVKWTRGVDTNLFYPLSKNARIANDRPTYLYVGRVSKEKNIEAFLDLKLEGNKTVVGDGPELKRLSKKYPDVFFTGALKGNDLALFYRTADVFVFPSKTDTFGMVIIEALACGTPVAAYPVTGPKDILTPEVGAMNDNLGVAIQEALKLDRNKCTEFVQKNYVWSKTAKMFIDNLRV